MALDVGMLGYRFMGEAHANALARLEMFFTDAPATNRDVIVGRNEDALAEAAGRLGFDRTATDWREVVDDVDVFYNLGPNDLHAEPSIAALESGTPVLCEKPLARDVAGAEPMAAAADAAGIPAGTAFNYRFVPAIQHAKGLIADGELGEIRHVRGSYLQDWLVDPEAPWSWRNDAEVAGSGALGDLGAHTIDLLQYLVGEQAGEIDRVSGHLRTFVAERPVPGGGDGGDDGDGDGGDGGGGLQGGEGSDETRPVTVDDAYSAQVAFESGVMGTLEASRVATGHKNDHVVEVEGTQGGVRFSLERLNELEVMLSDDRGYQTVLVTDADDPYVDRWWPPGHVLGWEHTFVHENYEFLNAVAEGDAAALADSPVATFEEGLATQRVLEAVQRSDERGAWVEVA